MFELYDSTVFTACIVILVLAGTLPAVALFGFRFPDTPFLALLEVYAAYMIGAAYYTVTSSGRSQRPMGRSFDLLATLFCY